MNKIPKEASLTSGAAEGESELEAFDNALIEAGIGNVNLVKVSSILPEKCSVVNNIKPEPGEIVYTALTKATSSEPEIRLSASVSIAESFKGIGVISEFKGSESKEKTEEESRRIAERMLKKRGLKNKRIYTESASHTVKKHGSVVAAVIFK
ncbi:MAG: pyruvoyl-dependent arginine decarboxylase [Candidatus Hadarchaeia archaeon]